MSKGWKSFFWAVGVIVLVVLIYIFGPMIFHGHLTTVAAQLNFAALLGTLLGTTMAAAGLVVALVSIVSFNTLDRRIEDKFQKMVKESEQDQRSKTNAMFQGFALQLQSINTSDLYAAETLLEEALKFYPDLPGSRKQLALRFFNSTEQAYIRKIFPPNTITQLRVINDGASAVWNHQAICQNFTPAPEGTYSHEAEQWLQRAIQNGEDENSFLSYCLAKLHGMRGRFDSMTKFLSAATTIIQQAETVELLRLICECAPSCQSDKQLAQLSEVLNLSIPLSKESISAEMTAFKPDQHHFFVAFVARRRVNSFSGFQTPDVFQLRIHPVGDKFQIAFVGENEITRWPEKQDDAKEIEYLNMDETWDVINNHCWVLARVQEP